MIPLFADVILPLPVPGTFTYLVPHECRESIAIGKRVVVQFGAKKIYTALVSRLHNQPPELHKAKLLLEVLDEEPVVHPHNIEFWQWVAAYYMCTLGEVMNAGMPQGLKLDSETNIALHPEWDGDEKKLTDTQFIVVQALRVKNKLSIQALQKLVGKRTVQPLIKSLIENNVVYAFEKLRERYKPKMVSFLELEHDYTDETVLKKTLEELQHAKRQHEALLAFLQAGEPEIRKSELTLKQGVSPAAIKQLVQKGILHEQKKEVERLWRYPAVAEEKEYTLSPAQEEALRDIKKHFNNHRVVLLQGITSSGKTQLYMELIKEAIASGKQALYLLPEIALTVQLVRRLREVFGNAIGVYHSKFSMNERVEIWNKLLRKEYKAVIGARSALFLPFGNLGLIVVDEEHDPSFKQFDPAPRYQARDAAIYFASQTGAKVLLGTGTPSMESYENARLGKYGYVKLSERYGGVPLPQIIMVNLREEVKKHRMKSIFSMTLLEEIKSTLAKKEQVILFQNRRGFAPYLSCYHCGW
ncbi:MAG TPA: primosomal protein N', partial [Chitinophagales bacterium]|nr:primosomal protein N' [Chitinophagales bacterium]